jgi:hypothetical protein
MQILGQFWVQINIHASIALPKSLMPVSQQGFGLAPLLVF